MGARNTTLPVHVPPSRRSLRVAAARLAGVLPRATTPRTSAHARDRGDATPDGSFTPAPRSIRAMERL